MIADDINKKTDAELQSMGLMERYEALEKLGMLAHEEMIGHPERPVETWTQDELTTVVKLFRSWPSTPEFAASLPKFEARISELLAEGLGEAPQASRKDKLSIATRAFAHACREVLGFDDFPEIELVYAPGPSPGYYGGLRPDGKLQICSRNILQGSVAGSDFTGDMSFIELALHESTHRLQNFMAEKSDGATLDENTNMLAAQQFYEATDALRKRDRDVYWQHPFERQARDVAAAICTGVEQALPKNIPTR